MKQMNLDMSKEVGEVSLVLPQALYFYRKASLDTELNKGYGWLIQGDDALADWYFKFTEGTVRQGCTPLLVREESVRLLDDLDIMDPSVVALPGKGCFHPAHPFFSKEDSYRITDIPTYAAVLPMEYKAMWFAHSYSQVSHPVFLVVTKDREGMLPLAPLFGLDNNGQWSDWSVMFDCDSTTQVYLLEYNGSLGPDLRASNQSVLDEASFLYSRIWAEYSTYRVQPRFYDGRDGVELSASFF